LKFHNFITENVITESINDKGILKAVFMAGNPGAGKSYTLKKVSDGTISPRIVNIDKWIEFSKIAYGTPEHEHAKKVTENELYLYVNSMLPLFVDTTSTYTTGVVRRRNILEKLGYDTALIYVQTSLETSLERVKKRNEKGPRVVSLDTVKEYYMYSTKIKKFLQHSFKLFIEVNNDDDALTNEAVLKAYNRMSWFFNSPVKNRVGNDIIETMKTNNWKYLTDGIYGPKELYSKIDQWYRSV
jgi:predicted ABC-type ATPase